MTPEFEVIGPYRIVRVLGKGGMGTVFHGIHAKSQEPVAIKVIASSLAQHPRFRRRFDAEIQTLIKLKHPNIIQIIGFGEEKGHLFYSMEFVDGENLQQKLRREKKLSWERVVELAIEISSALKHAHDFGITHRDLKPANIMINSAGTTKLADFGIAKVFDDPWKTGQDEEADHTVEGSVLGTADYMAPEQAEGKPVTTRSDLYALGSMCYSALAGRPPFAGKNIPEILYNVRHKPLTPLSQVAPETPKELCVLIEDLMRKEPSLRPPTALVVCNRFQALRTGLTRKSSDTIRDHTQTGKLKEFSNIDIGNDDAATMPKPKSSSNETVVTHWGKDLGAPQAPNPLQKPPAEEKTSVTLPSVAGPNDKTQVASHASDFEFSNGEKRIKGEAKDHFTEVDESHRRRSSIFVTDPEPTSTWSHWLGISVLLAALIICLGTIYWMSRPRSANDLYQQIMAAMESENDEQIANVEPVAEQFCHLYSEDSRVPEVEAILAEIDSMRLVRQLQRRARRSGSDQLDPVEQAYLECIRAEGLNAEIAKRKLSAFITVFSGNEKLTNKQRQFLILANKTLKQLNDRPALNKNMSIDTIEKQMSWAEANLAPFARAEWFRSLIELFEDKSWAKDLIAIAKLKLRAMDTPETAVSPK